MNYWPAGVSSPGKLLNAPFVTTLTQTAAQGTPNLSLNNPVPYPSANSTCLVAACGAPPGSNFTVGTGFRWTDYSNSQIYMYNLMIEKEFASNVVSVGFVGQASRHLPQDHSKRGHEPAVAWAGRLRRNDGGILPNPCQLYNAQIPLLPAFSCSRTRQSATIMLSS